MSCYNITINQTYKKEIKMKIGKFEIDPVVALFLIGMIATVLILIFGK